MPDRVKVTYKIYLLQVYFSKRLRLISVSPEYRDRINASRKNFNGLGLNVQFLHRSVMDNGIPCWCRYPILSSKKPLVPKRPIITIFLLPQHGKNFFNKISRHILCTELINLQKRPEPFIQCSNTTLFYNCNT